MELIDPLSWLGGTRTTEGRWGKVHDNAFGTEQQSSIEETAKPISVECAVRSRTSSSG